MSLTKKKKGISTGLEKALLKPKKPLLRSLSIRSRHPSAEPLRQAVFLREKAVYRHGSTSEHPAKYEINSIQSVRTCSSKLLMKRAFDAGGVKHLPWILLSNAKLDGNKVTDGKTSIKFPIVIKHFYGSRGQGNYKVDTPEEFTQTIKGKSRDSYLIEPFYNGTVEYRVHITNHGAVYSLRKMLKSDVPKDKRWFRNDSNCVWITELEAQKDHQGNFLRFTNEPNKEFNKPNNWNEIIEECKKALKAAGGDILAVDVKAQSTNSNKGKRERVDFYILEVNSAPSMGKITLEVYKKELKKILENKYDKFK